MEQCYLVYFDPRKISKNIEHMFVSVCHWARHFSAKIRAFFFLRMHTWVCTVFKWNYEQHLYTHTLIPIINRFGSTNEPPRFIWYLVPKVLNMHCGAVLSSVFWPKENLQKYWAHVCFSVSLGKTFFCKYQSIFFFVKKLLSNGLCLYNIYNGIISPSLNPAKFFQFNFR